MADYLSSAAAAAAAGAATFFFFLCAVRIRADEKKNVNNDSYTARTHTHTMNEFHFTTMNPTEFNLHRNTIFFFSSIFQMKIC